jgi:SAM-dependent methyltransferase
VVNAKSSGTFLESGQEEVDCLLCGRKTATRTLWPDAQAGHIVRCRGCGLAFRTPRRREKDQTRHFSKEWTEARPAFFLEDYRYRNLKKIAGWILGRHPSPGAILDIGCSYGALLAQFPETWRRVGVEPSAHACHLARTRLPGGEILPGSLGSVSLPEKAFEVITMVDTIYYLPQPIRDLSRLADLLKPGGVILIESPNFANRGMVYRWLGHAFDDTWMYFYTPRSLAKILNRAGLQVVDRMDLPGHRTGSPNGLARLIAGMEFTLLAGLRRLSWGKLDFLPHFCLLAQKRQTAKSSPGIHPD